MNQHFQTTDMDQTGNNGQNQTTSKQYYALGGQGKYLKRFKLKLRVGSIYSIPYALLPIIILNGNGSLDILSHGLNVNIRGRNLKELEKWLSEEIVLWIKESASGRDTGEANVFVSDIKIEGDEF